MAAVDEGIRFLRAQAPLNRLVASAALTAAAADGARHTCSTGAESSNSLEQAAHYGTLLKLCPVSMLFCSTFYLRSDSSRQLSRTNLIW